MSDSLIIIALIGGLILIFGLDIFIEHIFKIDKRNQDMYYKSPDLTITSKKSRH